MRQLLVCSKRADPVDPNTAIVLHSLSYELQPHSASPAIPVTIPLPSNSPPPLHTNLPHNYHIHA